MSTDLSRLTAVVDDFSTIEDNNERADLLIEFAESFKQVPEEIAKTPYPEDRKVPGCESDVFIFTQPQEQGFKFYFGIENPQGISAMALAAIIDETLSGVSESELKNIDDQFVHTLFGKQLSMGKGQGLTNMIRMTKIPSQWLS